MKKVMLDIDGVLNNYPQTFIDYVNDYYNLEFKSLEEIKENLDYKDFREIKDNYKFSNYKHDAPLKEGVIELINYFKSKNYLIYIITSRDLFEKNQLDLTLNWLKKNKINYDFIYQAEDKSLAIYENFHHFDVVVEDNLQNLINIKRIDKKSKCFYVNNIFNVNNDIIYVKNLYQIINILKEKKNENKEI